MDFLPILKSTLGCRCCNHGSISTKFLFSLLKIKAGLARGMAEEDRDMVYAIFSLRGLCWSPAFRRITEQCATGRKWASESQLYSRTQKLSFRVYIFKKQKSKKKGLKLENSWGTKNFILQSIDLPTGASLSKVKVNSAALLYKVSQLVLYEQL